MHIYVRRSTCVQKATATERTQNKTKTILMAVVSFPWVSIRKGKKVSAIFPCFYSSGVLWLFWKCFSDLSFFVPPPKTTKTFFCECLAEIAFIARETRYRFVIKPLISSKWTEQKTTLSPETMAEIINWLIINCDEKHFSVVKFCGFCFCTMRQFCVFAESVFISMAV